MSLVGRRIVIDADVAGAAASRDEVERGRLPAVGEAARIHAGNCRGVLRALVQHGHTLVRSPTLQLEWRRCSREATRVVIVFTDASFKSPMVIPEARGGSLDDLKHAIMANRIILSIFAPQMPCYDALTDIDKSEVELIPYDASQPDGAVVALRDFTADTANFKNVLKALAASVSKSADTELL